MLYIGIDLGTSAVKLLLVDEIGNIVNEVSKEYPVYYPLMHCPQILSHNHNSQAHYVIPSIFHIQFQHYLPH